MRIASSGAEHAPHGGIQSQNGAVSVERNHTRRNIFQHCFHQLAPALQLLHRLLQVVCELVDLRAVVAQLGGHGIEGSHQHAKLVLCLLRDLVVKISSGDFARALSESLDRNGHLLGKKERQPHHGEEQQDGEESENQQHLGFQGAQILLLGFVLAHFCLDQSESVQKIGARTITGSNIGGVVSHIDSRKASDQIVPSLRLPYLHATREGA